MKVIYLELKKSTVHSMFIQQKKWQERENSQKSTRDCANNLSVKKWEKEMQNNGQ